MTDFLLGIAFWILFEGLSWPLRFALAPLGIPHDVNRMLSRVAGPLGLVFIFWIAAHFGVTLHPAAFWGLYVLAAATGVSLWLRSGRDRPRLRTLLIPIGNGRLGKAELGLEVLGLALFFGYLAFIRLAPEMTFAQENNGSEKFTNAAIFWSCWNADTLPPEDYWLAGLPQAYYYFGHFFWVMIGKAGGFSPLVVIPLALSRLTLLVWEASYLLARAFDMRRWQAAAGALLMAWGGNPDAILSVIRQMLQIERPLFMEPPYSPEWYGESWNLAGYHFWDSARVLKGVINEVPAWTAILGDFHSHHFALPWTLGAFALLMAGDRWLNGERRRRSGTALVAAVWLLLSCAAVISSIWLLPLLFVAGLAWFLWGRSPRPLHPLVAGGLVTGLVLVVFMLVRLSIGGLPSAPADPHATETGLRALLDKSPIRILGYRQRSLIGEQFRHWGFHLTLLGVASAVCMAGAWRERERMKLAGAGAGLLLVHLAALRSETYLLWIAAVPLIALMATGPEPWLNRRAAFFLAGAAIVLASLEIYYIRDGNRHYVRTNTYFKLSISLWPLLTAGVWMLGLRLWQAPLPKPLLLAARLMLSLMIPAAFALPALGLPARTLQARGGDGTHPEPTLNAFNWLHHREGYKAEALMLDWIRSNVAPGMTVIEYAYDIPLGEPGYRESHAGGYDYFARVASLAGRPVPLGWPHHEFQWRGPSVDPIIQQREAAIRRLYSAKNTEAIHEAAMELEATWVVLGKVERENLGEEQFTRLKSLLGSAGHLRGAFPENDPSSFIYELH